MRPITARDLMNPDVLTVDATMTVRELAAFLVENEISGAPVEDGEGRLVGVVSLADLAAASAGGRDGASTPHAFAHQGFDTAPSAELAALEIDDESLTVADIMTPALYTIDEHATVSEVASTMLDGHVHRLLVTGSEPDTVVGILSTSDLLGLLIEEPS